MKEGSEKMLPGVVEKRTNQAMAEYGEDINLPRIIEPRKTCEVLQRCGQKGLKGYRKSNKKIWGMEETERLKDSSGSDGKYEGTWQDDLR